MTTVEIEIAQGAQKSSAAIAVDHRFLLLVVEATGDALLDDGFRGGTCVSRLKECGKDFDLNGGIADRTVGWRACIAKRPWEGAFAVWTGNSNRTHRRVTSAA